MSRKQKEILEELKKTAQKLGHSPTRREVPSLSKGCYRYFSSFNKAKEKANLEIKNVRIRNFPKNAFIKDKDIAFIAAYLTADGHIYKDLKGFYFSSKDLDNLNKIEKRINRKFGLKGLYRKGSGFGKSFKLLFFNSHVTKFLTKIGIPAGDKIKKSFSMPNWVKSNKDLTREYLKIIFYCEGSKYKQSKNTEAIKINFNKSEKLLQNILTFMKDLKNSLKKFNIETTNIWICKGNIRKRDGIVTKQVNFRIKSNSLDKFINKIGWLK